MDYTRRAAASDPLYHHNHTPNPNPPPPDPYYPHYPPPPSSYTTHYSSSSSYYPPPNPITPSLPFSSPTHTPLGPPGTESYAPLSSYRLPHLTYGPQSAADYALQSSQAGALSSGAAAAAAGYYQEPAPAYSHQLSQVGAGAAAAYYQDPAAAHPHPQSWAVKEAIRQYGPAPVTYPETVRQYGADPAIYPPVIESSNTELVLPSVPINGISHPLVDGVYNQRMVEQSVYCEVCKLVCTSKDVYDRHVFGKKHKRNLTLLLNSDSVTPAISSMPLAVGLQTTRGHSKFVASEDLETKRLKLMEGGVPVDSVMVCSLCNVVCNSETVFQKHLAGQKHATQAGTRPANGMVPSMPPVTFRTSTVGQTPFKNGTRQGLNKRKIVQSAWCEICKIDCTSKDVLDKHKSGKKHKKKVEQLEESKTKANPVDAQSVKKPVIGPEENPSATKGKKNVKSAAEPAEDIETKRRKIMEGGAAADAVRVCEVCNVVCNSPTVFSSHLSGQKHITMVQQLQSGVAAPGPSAVTAD